jgi:hypothetical protein
MSLVGLEVKYDCLTFEPDVSLLVELLTVFLNDFIYNPFEIDGLKIKVILNPSKVRDFENYPETFVHLITRKNSVNRRVFDPHRANKLHWVKHILLNKSDDDIYYFEYEEGNGSMRDYYWYKNGNFLVIMEKIRPDYLIITSFNIDDNSQRNMYERRYNNYKKK